jgi:hypothetical protein
MSSNHNKGSIRCVYPFTDNVPITTPNRPSTITITQFITFHFKGCQPAHKKRKQIAATAIATPANNVYKINKL